MKIILQKEIPELGKSGDIVEVKDGYARNFLFPREMALECTPKNLKRFEENKKRAIQKEQKRVKLAQALAAKLQKLSCTVAQQTGEDEKLFGAVTAKDISNALKEQGIEIDKKDILLTGSIKELGVYSVEVRLHPEVIGKVKVWVVKKGE